MREKFYRFMQGRYGQDELYRFLVITAIICVIANLFFKNRILTLIAWVLLLYGIFRMFSKNHSARYRENQSYLNATSRLRRWFGQQKRLMEERKYHHIFTCPKCKQKIRIPKGKGKIMVRCPKCRHEFQRRS